MAQASRVYHSVDAELFINGLIKKRAKESEKGLIIYGQVEGEPAGFNTESFYSWKPVPFGASAF